MEEKKSKIIQKFFKNTKNLKNPDKSKKSKKKSKIFNNKKSKKNYKENQKCQKLLRTQKISKNIKFLDFFFIAIKKTLCVSILGIRDLTRAFQSNLVLRKKSEKIFKKSFFFNQKILMFFFCAKRKKKKCYFPSFANWGDYSLTRALQSGPFQNPGGFPERDIHGAAAAAAGVVPGRYFSFLI